MVIGDRRPFVSALLTLDADEAVAFARERGMVVTGLTALSRDPVVLAEIQRCVGEVNATLSSVEQVKRWTLLERDFAVGEELTPTLKVRRKVVVEKYAADIEANYSLTK